MSSFHEKILSVVKSIAQETGTSNPFAGKKVSILGDFSSAYPLWIPEGMTASPPAEFTDASKMWWHQLLTKLGARLCVNYSDKDMRISGTYGANRAANQGLGGKLHLNAGDLWKGLDGREWAVDSQQNPDIVIVYLGINDYITNMTLGDYSDAIFSSAVPDRTILSESTESNNVSNGYQIILNDIITAYPEATIYCVAPQTVQKSGTYPFKNTATTPWSMPELEELIRKLCMKFGAKEISLSNYGIRGVDAMIGEDGALSDKQTLTPEAHEMIAKAVYNKMQKFPISWNTRNDVE